MSMSEHMAVFQQVIPPSRRVPSRRCLALLLVMLVGMGTLWSTVACADSPRVKKEKVTRQADPSYQAVFARISQAWRAGDQKTLAGLVHPDGLEIISGGTRDHAVSYSPSQSFYYFRNLFQTSHTLTFAMTRLQKSPQGDRVHGLATWESTTSTGQRATRLVIVLARHQNRWYLNEITTIK